ncbi:MULTISPECIES: hypothetical protein [Pseudomonas]|jgi:hypothetical protein|uniref:Uncharacterized protein n=1 Tax=Pseudomonas gorinensis TaxID=3240790 RepID=A0ACA7P781_9PSED|nr:MULTISPECIES: hypothetical protein [Pseudomonas]AHC35813.1 hypothetical protein U771_16470 [Pseudomonas sp. TKP]WLI48276.1 hypothetical protein PSH63_17375 [Pseudomonas sp. FP833]
MLANAANGYEALLSSNLDALLSAFAPAGAPAAGVQAATPQ